MNLEKEVIELRNKGLRNRQMAEHVGVHLWVIEKTIKELLRRGAIERKFGPEEKTSKLSKEVRDEIAQRYKSGETVREIGASTGFGYGMVRKLLKLMGLLRTRS